MISMASPRQITMAVEESKTHRKRLRSAICAVAWTFIATLALRFIVRDALRYFTLDEHTFGRFWPRRAYLVPHIAGGMTALLLGPFQFWSGLRNRALGVHRWTGRLYLTGILLAASNAFYLAFFIPESDGGWMNGVSLFMLAAVWLASGAMAYVAIRNGRVQIHKEWMIRSYVLTFSFVNFRWWIDLPFISTIGTRVELIATIGWLGWTLPLFVTELVLQWRNVQRNVRSS